MNQAVDKWMCALGVFCARKTSFKLKKNVMAQLYVAKIKVLRWMSEHRRQDWFRNVYNTLERKLWYHGSTYCGQDDRIFP